MPPEETATRHANRHVPAFLALPLNGRQYLQVIEDGRMLTSANIMANKLSLKRPMLILDTPESIGMKLPKPKHKKKALTVRDIADTVGHATPVPVIDVEFQEELEGWTFADLVDYFEDESRLTHNKHKPSSSRRPQRKAAATVFHQPEKVINQISYEFSRTPLSAQVLSPAFVRDLDWIDTVWPADLRQQGNYPAVQYYCLTSAADSYTDFHVDFGGTSVWYHVLSGSKQFCLLEPTRDNLEVYEDWLCLKDQLAHFLPEMLKEGQQVIRLELKQHETLIIPSGWIHSVYTPTDSLVFGGNFLHGLDMDMQLKINSLEVRRRVVERFRVPYFVPLQYYAGGVYLNKLRQGDVCDQEVQELESLILALKVWWRLHSKQQEVVETEPVTMQAAAQYAAEQTGCSTFDGVLAAIETEHLRVFQHGIGPNLSISAKPPASLPQARPKIRLKVSAPSPPLNKAETNDEQEENPFRITLSASCQDMKPLPADIQVARCKPHEDRSSFVNEKDVINDEEWEPPEHCTKSRIRKAKGKAPLPMKKPKTTTTARQRLLKKVR